MDGFIGFIIFIAICIFSSLANKKKTNSSTTSSKPAESPAAPQSRPVPKPAAQPAQKPYSPPKPAARPAAAPVMQERRYYDSTCMTESSRHDHDRRMEQLDTFLKEGIIGKEEYKILQQRYQQYR